MKPLLATKITRDRREIGDYIPAAAQLTDDGRADFAQRQEERRIAAQGKPEPGKVGEVVTIRRRKT